MSAQGVSCPSQSQLDVCRSLPLWYAGCGDRSQHYHGAAWRETASSNPLTSGFDVSQASRHVLPCGPVRLFPPTFTHRTPAVAAYTAAAPRPLTAYATPRSTRCLWCAAPPFPPLRRSMPASTHPASRRTRVMSRSPRSRVPTRATAPPTVGDPDSRCVSCHAGGAIHRATAGGRCCYGLCTHTPSQRPTLSMCSYPRGY